MKQLPIFDVAVIGGGLAGLTAATFAARAGRTVVLFERAPQPGGRATTQNKEGFYFNQGPHALYRGGKGVEVLRELGVTYSGAVASPDGSWALRNDEKYPIPRGAAALAMTRLLSHRSKVEAAILFAKLGQSFPVAEWNHISLRQWLDTQIQHEDLRSLFEALLRLSTYCDDAEIQSAGAALAQMIIGQEGVDYLDEGWQSLVTSLQTVAQASGVQIKTHAAVDTVHYDGGANTISLVNGEAYSARTVIATVSPAMLSRMVNEGRIDSLQQWSRSAVPIYASCLDIALRRLPEPENQFVIGLDKPLYYSVHTRSAQLAPEGGAVIQLAKYLRSEPENNANEDVHELEALLDSLQPGWRDELMGKRFLPRMLVSNAVVTAAQAGTAGRPGPAVPELPSLFVAGDWVGADGMLADASLASAREAAQMALNRLNETGSSIDARQELAPA